MPTFRLFSPTRRRGGLNRSLGALESLASSKERNQDLDDDGDVVIELWTSIDVHGSWRELLRIGRAAGASDGHAKAAQACCGETQRTFDLQRTYLLSIGLSYRPNVLSTNCGSRRPRPRMQINQVLPVL
jgi:hypothetical protein